MEENGKVYVVTYLREQCETNADPTAGITKGTWDDSNNTCTCPSGSVWDSSNLRCRSQTRCTQWANTDWTATKYTYNGIERTTYRCNCSTIENDHLERKYGECQCQSGFSAFTNDDGKKFCTNAETRCNGTWTGSSCDCSDIDFDGNGETDIAYLYNGECRKYDYANWCDDISTFTIDNTHYQWKGEYTGTNQCSLFSTYVDKTYLAALAQRISGKSADAESACHNHGGIFTQTSSASIDQGTRTLTAKLLNVNSCACTGKTASTPKDAHTVAAFDSKGNCMCEDTFERAGVLQASRRGGDNLSADTCTCPIGTHYRQYDGPYSQATQYYLASEIKAKARLASTGGSITKPTDHYRQLVYGLHPKWYGMYTTTELDDVEMECVLDHGDSTGAQLSCGPSCATNAFYVDLCRATGGTPNDENNPTSCNCNGEIGRVNNEYTPLSCTCDSSRNFVRGDTPGTCICPVGYELVTTNPGGIKMCAPYGSVCKTENGINVCKCDIDNAFAFSATAYAKTDSYGYVWSESGVGTKPNYAYTCHCTGTKDGNGGYVTDDRGYLKNLLDLNNDKAYCYNRILTPQTGTDDDGWPIYSSNKEDIDPEASERARTHCEQGGHGTYKEVWPSNGLPYYAVCSCHDGYTSVLTPHTTSKIDGDRYNNLYETCISNAEYECRINRKTWDGTKCTTVVEKSCPFDQTSYQYTDENGTTQKICIDHAVYVCKIADKIWNTAQGRCVEPEEGSDAAKCTAEYEIWDPTDETCKSIMDYVCNLYPSQCQQSQDTTE